MKKLNKIMLLMALLPLLFVSSCKDDDPAPADAFGIMTEYMMANDLDVDKVISGWITARPVNENGTAKTPAEIEAWAAGYYIMDIRSTAHFGEGHIKGAHSSTLASIVADAGSADKPILVVCYSGQSASHATVALRLSGHPDAKVLKWGMSGWTRENECDKWTGATASGAKQSGNWTMDGTADLGTYEYPTISSTSTDGATILAERVAVMTEKGFQGVASTDVYGTPSNYLIHNYWDDASITEYGNITSAYQINPLTLAGDNFKAYDPAAMNVTYCWTGQTSSMVTAYLTVLGYNAKSLKNGVNSMIYDDLNAHKWTTLTFDYPVE